MMILVNIFILIGCTIALPNLDWSKIIPNEAYLDPLPNVTDIAQPRIVGGTEVVPNSIPYQVALLINGGSFCGGSLISHNFVLTAAHCTFRSSYIQLTFGAHNIRAAESSQVVVTSTTILSHPRFIQRTLTNDIALIRIPYGISTKKHIQTVNLAPASAGSFAGSTALLTGWGKTSDSLNSISSVLKQIRLTVITNALCASTYGSIKSSTICTSGFGTVGGCNGDSGGPLVTNGVQIGIASFVSSGGCQSGLPTGFARVSSFRNWIAQNAGV